MLFEFGTGFVASPFNEITVDLLLQDLRARFEAPDLKHLTARTQRIREIVTTP